MEDFLPVFLKKVMYLLSVHVGIVSSTRLLRIRLVLL